MFSCQGSCDAVIVAIIFIRIVMERSNSSYFLAVAGKEKEETNLQYQNINWHEKNPNLKTWLERLGQAIREMIHLSPTFDKLHDGKEGDQTVVDAWRRLLHATRPGSMISEHVW